MFRTVLIVFFVIYLLRFLLKLLSPWMMRKAQSKITRMAEDQMKQRGFNQDGRTQRPEGSVTVEKIPKKKASTSKKSTDDDYVDFEEVN